MRMKLPCSVRYKVSQRKGKPVTRHTSSPDWDTNESGLNSLAESMSNHRPLLSVNGIFFMDRASTQWLAYVADRPPCNRSKRLPRTIDRNCSTLIIGRLP